jgi:hypothetical protein
MKSINYKVKGQDHIFECDIESILKVYLRHGTYNVSIIAIG